MTEETLGQEIKIGHPDDDGFPAETVTVAEFIENPQRLYEQESVETLCGALGVPYARNYDWVWADVGGRENDIQVPEEVPLTESEVVDMLAGDANSDRPNGIVGFRHSQRNPGLAFHKCSDGALQTQSLEFETPQAE